MSTEQYLAIYWLIGFIFHGVLTVRAKWKDPSLLPDGILEWILFLLLVIVSPWIWPLTLVSEVQTLYTSWKEKPNKGP